MEPTALMLKNAKPVKIPAIKKEGSVPTTMDIIIVPVRTDLKGMEKPIAQTLMNVPLMVEQVIVQRSMASALIPLGLTPARVNQALKKTILQA
jgi:hypothetical protein